MKILIILGSLCFVLLTAERHKKDGNPKVIENYVYGTHIGNPSHNPQHTYSESVKEVVVEKKIPVPYTVDKKVPYTVEKRVPYQVRVPVPHPYTVEKKVPYHVRELVKVPYYVPEPYDVIKKVPYEVKVPVPRPYEVKVEVPKPYTVEKKVPYPVKVLVPTPYTVEKKVPYPVKYEVPVPQPYTVEKRIPYEVKVPVERPYTVHVPKPYQVTVERKVPYPVTKRVPYNVKVPVDRPYPVVVPKHVPYTVKIPVPSPYTVEKPVEFEVEKLVPYHVHVPVDKPFAVYKQVPYPVYKDVHYPVYPDVSSHNHAQNGTQISYGGWNNYNPYEYKAVETQQENAAAQSNQHGAQNPEASTQEGTHKNKIQTVSNVEPKPIKYSQQIYSHPEESKVPTNEGSQKQSQNVGTDAVKYSQQIYSYSADQTVPTTNEGSQKQSQNVGTDAVKYSQQIYSYSADQTVPTHSGSKQGTTQNQLSFTQDYSSNRVPKQHGLDKGTQNQVTNNFGYSQPIYTYSVDDKVAGGTVQNQGRKSVPVQNNDYVSYSIQVPSTNDVGKKEEDKGTNGTFYFPLSFSAPKQENSTAQQKVNYDWGNYHEMQGHVLNMVPAPTHANFPRNTAPTQGNYQGNVVPYTGNLEYQNMVPYSALSSSNYLVPNSSPTTGTNNQEVKTQGYQVSNSASHASQQSVLPTKDQQGKVLSIAQQDIKVVPSRNIAEQAHSQVVPATQNKLSPIVVENNLPYVVKDSFDGSKPSFKNVLSSLYDQLDSPMPQEVKHFVVPQGYPGANQDYFGTNQDYSGTNQEYSGGKQEYGGEVYQNGYQGFGNGNGQVKGYQVVPHRSQGYQYEGQEVQNLGGKAVGRDLKDVVPKVHDVNEYQYQYGGQIADGKVRGNLVEAKVQSAGAKVTEGNRAEAKTADNGYQGQNSQNVVESEAKQVVPKYQTEKYPVQYTVYTSGQNGGNYEDAISYDGWKVMKQ